MSLHSVGIEANFYAGQIQVCGLFYDEEAKLLRGCKLITTTLLPRDYRLVYGTWHKIV